VRVHLCRRQQSGRPAALCLAGVLGLAVALRAPLLGGGQIDYDEGVYWQSLRALADGHRLFTEVYSSQPPAFLMMLLPFQLLIGGIAAARFGVLGLTVVGIAAGGRLAWLLAGPWAGVLAAGILAADPLVFRESLTLQAEGPAVALALVSLAVAAEARARDGRTANLLAAGSGAALGLAILTKLLGVAAAPAVALLLAAPQAGGLRWGSLAAGTLGGCAAAAAVLLPFAGAWPVVWQEAVGLHVLARAVPVGGLGEGTVQRELPVAVIGVAGWAAALRSARHLAAATAAWAVPAGLLLAVQHPLWPHHVVFVTAPLAVAGGGLARPLRARAGLALAVGATAVVAGAAGSALYVRSLQQPASAVRPTVAALRTGTGAGLLVITDDQYAAALAGRDTPPQLVDTSLVRVRSGDLTTGEVEALARRPDVGAVLLATGRLADLPGLRGWLAAHFPDSRDLGGGRVLYLRADR